MNHVHTTGIAVIAFALMITQSHSQSTPLAQQQIAPAEKVFHCTTRDPRAQSKELELKVNTSRSFIEIDGQRPAAEHLEVTDTATNSILAYRQNERHVATAVVTKTMSMARLTTSTSNAPSLFWFCN